MKISLEALAVLDAIDRKGSFAAAAAATLHRVPSAISYTGRKLEEDLDIVLFQGPDQGLVWPILAGVGSTRKVRLPAGMERAWVLRRRICWGKGIRAALLWFIRYLEQPAARAALLAENQNPVGIKHATKEAPVRHS